MTRAEHLEALHRAIQRNERRMDEIAAWCYREGHCCPGCASPEWRSRCDKLERQRAWFKVLRAKA